jgi:A/G-specific adenine glycosylase
MRSIEDGRQGASLRRRLLTWYGRNRRDLPWRRTDDPYSVWISEVMLQQTRVETARGYYERFLVRFPTVDDLAAAAEGEVLKVWEGMGYYSRARNLHRAARRIVADHQGQLPTTYDGLQELPGVGPYTAAAVSSIAFDRPHPVLDGNVVRVLCRLLHIAEDPRRRLVRARLIDVGEALIPRAAPGDFNQALMELGARVCTPRKPRCDDCPLSAHCRAYAELEDPSTLPVRPPKRVRPHLQVTAGLIRKGNRLLLAQRPPGGMLAGLWEFPGGKQEPGESLAACLGREIREELGIDIEVERPVAVVDHEYTHLSITLHAFAARYRSGQVRALGCADWTWVAPGRLDDYAMPKADRKVIAQLEWEDRARGHFQTEAWLG